MKYVKFISVLLLTVIFSLVTSVAYATDVTPAISKNVEIVNSTSKLNYGATITVDKDKVDPGESFTVTVKKTDTNPIYTAKMVLNTSQINCLDTDNIAFEKLNGFAADTPTTSYGVTVSSTQITVQFGKQTASYNKAGDIFSITCKVSENAETGTIAFGNTSYIGYGCTQNNVLVSSAKGSGQMYFGFEIEIVASGSSGPGSGGTTPSPTVTATLTADKDSYTVGDTVTVTAALTPDQAATIASGSVNFTYDTALLDFESATASTALGSDAKATLFNATAGTCVASFTTPSGGTAQSVTTDGLVLATFQFTAKASGTAALAVTEVVAGDESSGPFTTAKGGGLSLTIAEKPAVTVVDYGSDYKLVKYVADSLPSDGQAYKIGDTVLTYVPAYATDSKPVFVMLVTTAPTDLTVSTVSGTYDTIEEASGDANKDNSTNIVDAQVVIYMVAKSVTSGTTGVDWLNSDVNGDGVITALDAQAIQYYVHNGVFGQFS